jgi:hypothetical protein
MSLDDSESPHTAIDAKLAGVLDSLPARPGWYERWRRLGPESTDEERLAVFQAIRDSGVIPDDAGFYLVTWQVDAIADRHADTALGHLKARLQAIEAAHGLEEGEIWEPDEAPEEYREVLEKYHRGWDELFADQLVAHGESAIAALFRADRPEYERRSEAGRQFFHGPPAPADPDVPDWLNALFDEIGAGITPESLMGPLGFRWHDDEGCCEIDAYPTSVELVGGASDGAVVSPGFSLDIEQLRGVFEEVVDLGWNALGWPDGDGPFIWVEGTYQGREVFLRVLAEAPEDDEPGAKVRLPR